jgi:hypothetical protein
MWVQGCECESGRGLASNLAAGGITPRAVENGKKPVPTRGRLHFVPIQASHVPEGTAIADGIRDGGRYPRAVISGTSPAEAREIRPPGPQGIATAIDRLCAYARRGPASAPS